MSLPTTHVMTAGDDAGLNAFGHPGFDHEIANLSFDPHQIACADAHGSRMRRMQPERIRVRNFIQPLRICTPGVNLNRQTKCRDQDSLISLQIVWMNMTLNVSWDRVFAPAPFSQRAGKEFELAARSREAAADFAIDFHPNPSTTLRVSVRTGNRYDIRRSRFRRASEHPAQLVFANVVKFFSRHGLFIDRTNPAANLKRAVTAHEFKRRQIFGRGFLRQARHRVFKNEAVVFIDTESRARLLFGFNELANPQRARRVDAPGQFHPEFVFFPNLAWIYLAGVGDVFAVTLARSAHHRLAKAEPLRVVRFV